MIDINECNITGTIVFVSEINITPGKREVKNVRIKVINGKKSGFFVNLSLWDELAKTPLTKNLRICCSGSLALSKTSLPQINVTKILPQINVTTVKW